MIYAYYLILFFGMGVLLPFLSVFFVNNTVLESNQVTMMMAFVPLVSFFSTNFFAYVSDRTRKYKTILIVAILLTIASCLLLGFSARFELVFIVVLMYGVFQFFMPIPNMLSENFVLQYSNERKVPYGRLRLFGSLGYAVAGFVAGTITDSFGLQVIFVIYALCLAIPLLMVPRFPEIREVDASHETAQEKGIYKQLFTNKRFIPILLCSFFILGAINVLPTFFGIYVLDHANLDLRFLGLTTLLSAMTEIPMMFYSNHLIERFGAYKILAFAAILNSIRFFSYLLFPSYGLILLVTATHGVGYGSAFTAIMDLIDKKIPANIRASAISLNSTLALGLGTFIITVLGSAFFDARSVFGLLAVFEIMGLALCVYLVLKKESALS